jgi:hypothetical protein
LWTVWSERMWLLVGQMKRWVWEDWTEIVRLPGKRKGTTWRGDLAIDWKDRC